MFLVTLMKSFYLYLKMKYLQNKKIGIKQKKIKKRLFCHHQFCDEKIKVTAK